MFEGVFGGLLGLFVGEAEAVLGCEGVFLYCGGLGLAGLEALEVIEAEWFDILDGGGGDTFGGGDDGIDEVSDVVTFEAAAFEGFGVLGGVVFFGLGFVEFGDGGLEVGMGGAGVDKCGEVELGEERGGFLAEAEGGEFLVGDPFLDGFGGLFRGDTEGEGEGGRVGVDG
jgi:hypothetical protein